MIDRTLTARFAKEAPSGHPNVTPKDAATLILLDRSGKVPKVLLGKRHHGHVFLPGKFVFPGGRVDPLDRLMSIGAPLDPRAEDRLMRQVKRPSPAKARALVLTAIRETFEETGLLLGRTAGRRAGHAGGRLVGVRRGQGPSRPLDHPFHRPRRHPAAAFTAVRHALLHRRRQRDRAQDRRRGRSRFRIGGTGVVAARRSQAARSPGDHRTRARGSAKADRRRFQPRPAGAVLQAAARQATAPDDLRRAPVVPPAA